MSQICPLWMGLAHYKKVGYVKKNSMYNFIRVLHLQEHIQIILDKVQKSTGKKRNQEEYNLKLVLEILKVWVTYRNGSLVTGLESLCKVLLFTK